MAKGDQDKLTNHFETINKMELSCSTLICPLDSDNVLMREKGELGYYTYNKLNVTEKEMNVSLFAPLQKQHVACIDSCAQLGAGCVVTEDTKYLSFYRKNGDQYRKVEIMKGKTIRSMTLHCDMIFVLTFKSGQSTVELFTCDGKRMRETEVSHDRQTFVLYPSLISNYIHVVSKLKIQLLHTSCYRPLEPESFSIDTPKSRVHCFINSAFANVHLRIDN